LTTQGSAFSFYVPTYNSSNRSSRQTLSNEKKGYTINLVCWFTAN